MHEQSKINMLTQSQPVKTTENVNESLEILYDDALKPIF